MKTPKIPSWCKGLPDSTILFSSDIMEFFKGYGDISAKQVCQYIKDGSLPEPSPTAFTSLPEVDESRVMRRNKKSSRKVQWLLGDIRKLRKDMLNDRG